MNFSTNADWFYLVFPTGSEYIIKAKFSTLESRVSAETNFPYMATVKCKWSRVMNFNADKMLVTVFFLHNFRYVINVTVNINTWSKSMCWTYH